MWAANRLLNGAWARSNRAMAVFALAVGLAAGLEVGADEAPSTSRPPIASRAATPTSRKPSTANALRRAPLPSDDWTYRPTVVVRRGTSQGSGTIIASVDGETLILTAAHVLKNEGQVWVELHRYNLGLERAASTTGLWPRLIKAAPAASDLAGDVAIVRVENLKALPYVARLTESTESLPRSSVVSSIGIDLGRKLSMWTTRLVETASIELNESGEARPFLITEKTPEHGRSGGGLFLATGELVGVCVGHAALEKGHRRGIFASAESIRLLLDDHQLNAAILRSNKRMARLRPARAPTADTEAADVPNGVVTTSREKSRDLPDPDGP